VGDSFFLLLIIVFVVAPVVLAIIALVKASNLRRELFYLKQNVTDLESMVNDLRSRPRAAATPEAPGNLPEESAPREEAERDPEDKEEASEETPPAGEAEQVAAESAGAADAPQIAAQAAHDERGSLEQRLTSRWMVWLGAFTVALAGIFLVKRVIFRSYIE